MRRDLDQSEVRFQWAERYDAETDFEADAAALMDAGADSVRLAARGCHLTVMVGKIGQEAYDRPQVVPLEGSQKLAKTFADFQFSTYHACLAFVRVRGKGQALRASSACLHQEGYHLRQYAFWTQLIHAG